MIFDPSQLALDTLPSVALEDRRQLPECQGVYFAFASGVLLYIGKAKNLNHRWLGHHRLIDLKQHSGVTISWLQIDGDMVTLAAVESVCIEHFRPALNGTETSPNSLGKKSYTIMLPKELSDRLDEIARKEWRTPSAQLEVMLLEALKEYRPS